MFMSVIKFIEAGGFWVLPILVIGAIGIGITFERWFKLHRAEIANRKMWDKLQPALQKGDFEAAREMTSNDKSYVSQLLSVAFERQGVVRRREDFEIAMDEVMMSIVPQLEKRTPYTALFANLATLMGLLGTILGLISAFEAVAHAAPSEKSALLSGSISEAMSCTAIGLVVAIPMLSANLFLNLKAGTIIDSLEMASLKTVNVISAFAAKSRNPQA
ncbi:MAG TPA: MotA/TolQ/ExbB proton channel family protein [Gallionellaceae bacterium]